MPIINQPFEPGQTIDAKVAVNATDYPSPQGIPVGNPRLAIPVYAPCVMSNVQLAGIVVQGIEVVLGIYPHLRHLLDIVVLLQPVAQQHFRCMLHHGDFVRPALFVKKVQCVVVVQYLFVEAEAGVYPKAEAGGDKRCCIYCGTFHLNTHKCPSFYDVIHRAYHLHIGIEIQSAVLVKNLETRIVAYESIFTHTVGFLSVRNDVDIKVILIPLLDFIVGEVLSPRSDTLEC